MDGLNFTKKFPCCDALAYLTLLKQMPYSMSSIRYNKLLDGFSRSVIQHPKFIIFYKLQKHLKQIPNEDCSVEHTVTTNIVNMMPSIQSPNKYSTIPYV